MIEIDLKALKAFDTTREIIGCVRAIRLQKNIPSREPLTLQYSGAHDSRFDAVIVKMCRLKESPVRLTGEKAAGASFFAGATEYTVPLDGLVNAEQEMPRLKKEIAYQQGFLDLVMKKLNNEKFVANAPAKALEAERKKQADAESKIKSLKATLAALSRQ